MELYSYKVKNTYEIEILTYRNKSRGWRIKQSRQRNSKKLRFYLRFFVGFLSQGNFLIPL